MYFRRFRERQIAKNLFFVVRRSSRIFMPKIHGPVPHTLERAETMSRTLTLAPNTILDLLKNIAADPQEFLRKVETIAFEPGKGLHGSAYVQEFRKDSPDATQIPAALAYLKKFVFFRNEKGGIDSVIIANKPLNHAIITALTASIDPEKLQLPADGCGRWQAAAPNSRKVVAYITHNVDEEGSILALDDLKLPDVAIDIQFTRLPEGNVMHVLTRNGQVFKADVRPEHVVMNRVPRMDKVIDNVKALLTVPSNGKVAAYYGTQNGLMFNEDLIIGTSGMDITGISMDSERRRFFFKTADNRICAVNLKEDFRPDSHPIPINDTMGTYQWLLAGPSVVRDQKQGIMLYGFNKSEDGRLFTMTRRVVDLPNTLTI